MLEKGSYIPWDSRFRRFLANKLEDGERMWRSIEKGPYVRTMIADPDDLRKHIIEPLSKMTEQLWERIKRLMYGSDVTNQVRHSRLMDEFNKFIAKEGESLESVYERLTTLVNIMDHNDVHPIPVPSYSHSPQPYYVTHPSSVVDYEEDYQGEFQRDSQEDKITTAMMLLARAITQKFSIPTNNRLRTSSNTRNQVVIQDGRVDMQIKNAGYGGNGNMNAGRQNKNQAFNTGNWLTQQNDESNQIVQRVPRIELNPGKVNVQCYNCNEKGHYARDYQKPRVRDAR
ncbi:retrovirus-related pol polyprotein from transposon TNT 1-94 [Tanacetum coccineum]